MKILNLFLFLGFGLTLSLSAQSELTKEDINLASENSIPGFEKSRELVDYYTAKNQMDSAKFYLNNSLKIGENLQSDTFVLKAFYDFSYFYRQTNQLDSSIYFEKQIINQTEKSNDKRRLLLRTKALYRLGNRFSKLNDVPEGLNYYIQSRELAGRNGFDTQYLRTTWDICNIYYAQKKYEELFVFIDETLLAVDNQKENIQREIINLKRFKAWYYGSESDDSNKKKEGLKILLDGHQYFKDVEDSLNQAFVFVDISKFYSDIIAPKYFLKLGEENFKRTKKTLQGADKAIFLSAYGKALVKNKMYPEAIKILKESKLLFKPYNYFSFYLDATSSLIEVYSDLGKNDLILEEFNDYKLHQDSLVRETYSDKLLDLEKKYETEKQEQKNQELKQANLLAESKSNLFGIIGLLLAALLSLGAYFYYKLSITKNKLERINASKNQLFAILAHDLKGPAMSFNELTSNMSYLIKQNKPERLLKAAEHFETAGEQVNRILTNLLDWAISQKDEFELNPQPVDVKEEIEAIMEDLKYATHRKGITIKTQLPENYQCNFDKNSFSIIVRNLLHNAIKFSHQGAEINVELSGNAGNKKLKIRDQGVGMPPELIHKINTGKTIESMAGTNQELGNALGLSTCFSLAEKNESSILVESKEGIGSEFILSLN